MPFLPLCCVPVKSMERSYGNVFTPAAEISVGKAEISAAEQPYNPLIWTLRNFYKGFSDVQRPRLKRASLGLRAGSLARAREKRKRKKEASEVSRAWPRARLCSLRLQFQLQKNADCRLQAADCRPGTKCRLGTKCRSRGFSRIVSV